MTSDEYVIILLIKYIIKIWIEKNRHIWGMLIQIEVQIIHSKKIIYKKSKNIKWDKIKSFWKFIGFLGTPLYIN